MQQLIHRNIKIAFSDTGKGNAVVLLHGFLENQKMWHRLISVLSKKNRVITIDLLGHGDTECLGYVHTMESNAEIVSAVLSKLKVQKSTIVGHSMGGYVALAFAEIFPEKVKGLVLLNSTSKSDSPERKANRDRAINAIKSDFSTFIHLSIANLFSPYKRKSINAAIEIVKNEALKTPLQGVIASLEGMKIRKDREFILKSTSFLKMLILGENDPVLIYEKEIEQIKGTNVKLITFPDGHMSHIENPVELENHLLDFLKFKK